MTPMKYIGEKPGSRRSGAELKGPTTYEVTYLVLASTSGNSVGDAELVRRTTGLPLLGQRHPFNTRSRCVAVDPHQVPTSKQGEVWEVDVRWEEQPWKREDDNKPPWERQARIRFDEVLVEDSPLTDLDDKPFRNAAGDPFEPKPTIPVSNVMATIERAELEFDEVEMAEWGNVTNSDIWRGYPRHAALMHMPTASDEYLDGTQFWNVVYRIEIKGRAFEDTPDLWRPLKVLNQGTRHWRWFGLDNAAVANSRTLIQATSDDNVASTEPVLLDLEGNKLGMDSTGKRLPDADMTPTWIEFRVYRERRFADLFPGA